MIAQATEEYARTPGFQVIAFAFAYLPVLLACLATALLLEGLAIHLVGRWKG